jgi:sugar O-acyltransferase (sialic acid O-acetyltransferase NeuD family)
MNRPLLLIGAGGHARVLLDALWAQGKSIIGVVDNDSAKHGITLLGSKVIGGDEVVAGLDPTTVALVNAVGAVRNLSLRQAIYDRFRKAGYIFSGVTHPSAVLAADVELGQGAQIMAGVVIQSGTIIGENVIVNTKSGVDHDCVIGAHAHIAPGATLCGGVRVGEGAFIGAGATVIQGVTLGRNCLVAAGAVVVADVADGRKVVGVPAKGC